MNDFPTRIFILPRELVCEYTDPYSFVICKLLLALIALLKVKAYINWNLEACTGTCGISKAFNKQQQYVPLTCP